jgi:uncharacterized damage-inducible protein DinB
MRAIEPFLESFRFTNFGVKLVTSDMTDEDALKRARGGEGASLSWTLGHLCFYRCRLLQLLGADRPLEFEEYDASAGDVANYPALAALTRTWEALAEELEGALDGVTDEQLGATPEGGLPKQRLLDTLVFVTWHEACHLGYVGGLRKELGYRATSELAVEAMRAAD